MPFNATIRFTKKTYALQAFCALQFTVQHTILYDSNAQHEDDFGNDNLYLLPVVDTSWPQFLYVTVKAEFASISHPQTSFVFNLQLKNVHSDSTVYRYLLAKSQLTSKLNTHLIDLQNAPHSGFVLPKCSSKKHPCLSFLGDTPPLGHDYKRANYNKLTTHAIHTNPGAPKTSRKLPILPRVSSFHPKYPRALYIACERLTPMTGASQDLGLPSVNSLQKTLSAMDIGSSVISTPFDCDDDSSIEVASKADSVSVSLDSNHKEYALSYITPTCDPSYPAHLNPFSNEDLSDCPTRPTSSVGYSCSPTEGSRIDSVPSFSIFTDEMYSTSRASVPETHVLVPHSTVICADSSGGNGQTPSVSRTHRIGKPEAPSPPPNELRTLVSVPSEKAIARVLPTAKPNSVRVQIDSTSSPIQRPFDTAFLSMHSCGVNKRPAPSLPIPAKRLVRADPQDSFIEYRELHERLYELNSRLTAVERDAKDLQSDIHQASNGHGDDKIALKNLSEANKLRETLMQEQTAILRRLYCQELEGQHSDLEHELRILVSKPDPYKNETDKVREAELLVELKSVVDKRADLADQIDKDLNAARSLVYNPKNTENLSSSDRSKVHKGAKKKFLTIFKGKRRTSTKN